MTIIKEVLLRFALKFLELRAGPLNSKIISQIKEHEGFRGRPYKDSVGVITIGYGRNLEVNPLTTVEGLILLHGDMVPAWKIAKSYYSYIDELNGPRQAVLVNMAYNLGNRIFGFKKMRYALLKEDYMEASRQGLDSLWAEQVGKRAEQLMLQLRTGKWQ